MKTVLNPYLGFKDNAREAMEYYQSIFGGELKISTFEEFHAAQSPDEAQLVMHAELHAPGGIAFFGSDTPPRMEYKPGTTMSMSLSGDDDEELSGYFEKLAEGGRVTMPLEKAIWGDKFGMLTDKFGVQWLVNITLPKA